jgi:hypothetical protein
VSKLQSHRWTTFGDLRFWTNEHLHFYLYRFSSTCRVQTVQVCMLLLAHLARSSRAVAALPRRCKDNSWLTAWVQPSWPGLCSILVYQTRIDVTWLDEIPTPGAQGNLFSTSNCLRWLIFLENLTVAQLTKKFCNEDFCLLGHNAIQYVQNQHKFLGDVSPLSCCSTLFNHICDYLNLT